MAYLNRNERIDPVAYCAGLQYVPPRTVTTPAKNADGDPICADCGQPVIEGVEPTTLMVHNVDTATSRTSTVQVTHAAFGALHVPGAHYLRDLGPSKPSTSYAA